jgi:hypothetical protein
MTTDEAKQLGWGDDAEAFSAWWNAANRECIKISTLGLHDLPDADFSGMFNGGMSPREAALEVLENADFPMDLVD